MAEAQLLLQMCLGQNHLLQTLESFHETLTQVKEAQSLRWEKFQEKFSTLQEKLKIQADHFSHLLSQSSLAQIEIRVHLEKFITQAQQISQNLSTRYQEMTREEWLPSLSSLSEKAIHLRQELKSINLKAAFEHISEAVLVDHYGNLGEARKIQWPRKILHVLASFWIVGIYLFSRGSFSFKMTVFGAFTAYALSNDILRLVWPKFNAWTMRDLKKYMRKEEARRLNSLTFYSISTFLVCAFFPKGVAILSVLFLGLGDPIASIIGIKFGKHKMGRLSLEGSLAFFFTCFGLSFLYPLLDPTFHGPLWLFAIFGGLIGAFSERWTFRLDDNFVIPIFSAIFLQLVLWLGFH